MLQTESMASSFSTSASYGGQISLSMPLDGSSVELCKALARRELEKERLDYELIRIKECINIYEKGYTIHPDSPFYPMCADVIRLPPPPAPPEPEPTPPSTSNDDPPVADEPKTLPPYPLILQSSSPPSS